MKIFISENERGFLFKNGVFQRMLTPGRHAVRKFLGETWLKTDITENGGKIGVAGVDVSVLLRDKNFTDSVAKIDVPNAHLALHFVDGRLIGSLPTGEFYFWNIFRKHTFQLVDITSPTIEIPISEILPLSQIYLRSEISEGQVGLLFFDRKFQKILESGVHYFWKNGVKVTVDVVDLRLQQLEINSQEILTADKVMLRLNFVCTYKISDALKIHTALKDHQNQIYVLTQLALREYVGRLKFDELLEQKDSIAAVVLQKLREKQDGLFVEFADAGLKDIILPGEIREIMNTVLIAEKTAQANVIARREEVASTRSLLNTAKLMDENATLYKLKELEYLEKICEKVGNISVSGGDLVSQLREILGNR